MAIKSKNKPKRRKNLVNLFRRKLLFLFFGVIGVSAAITLAAYYGAIEYYQRADPEQGSLLHILRLIIASIGDIRFFLAVFACLFLALFWLVTSGYDRRLYEISRGIYSLSKGDFDIDIKLKTNDEMAEIAHMINEAARRLKRVAAAESFAEKTKDRLVAGVTHDLRTPLTSIIGYLGLIVNGDLPAPTARHYAEVAYNKALRLDALIDEMFEATKFRYGKITPNKVRIDLVRLIEQLQEEFEASGATIKLNVADSPVQVDADGLLIARAVENLINNALKYGDKNLVSLTLFTDPDTAYIQIHNGGSAIPKEDLPFIFEPFYRPEGSKSQGLGLGLSIVKDIAEAHNGGVYVKSGDTGTTFELDIPLKD